MKIRLRGRQTEARKPATDAEEETGGLSRKVSTRQFLKLLATGVGAAGLGQVALAARGVEAAYQTGQGPAPLGGDLVNTHLTVQGHLALDPGASPTLYTGGGSVELNRYLQLINSPALSSASGLKAGGVLVADSYGYADPGKNDLVVKGNVSIGTTNAAGYRPYVSGGSIRQDQSGSIDNHVVSGGNDAWRFIFPSSGNPEGYGAGAGNFGIYRNGGTYNAIFHADGRTYFGGSVGVGVWPGEKLHVFGGAVRVGDATSGSAYGVSFGTDGGGGLGMVQSWLTV